MKHVALAILAMTVIVLPVAANAAPCRDAKGHFIKCPPPAQLSTRHLLPQRITRPQHDVRRAAIHMADSPNAGRANGHRSLEGVTTARFRRRIVTPR